MKSRLYLETVNANGQTMISDLFFNAPYKVMSPFYHEKSTQIMLMSASAGLLGGDELTADYIFHAGSSVEITSQGYEKVLDTRDKKAVKNVTITAEKNSVIKFMPFPVIPFAGSYFDNTVNAVIDQSAIFLYSDIFSSGRIGMGEIFKMRCFQSRVTVYAGEVFAFADNTVVLPELLDYNSIGLWNKFTHNGMMYAYFPDREAENQFLENSRELAGKDMKDCYVGSTRCMKGIVVRVLADSGDKIYNFFQNLSENA